MLRTLRHPALSRLPRFSGRPRLSFSVIGSMGQPSRVISKEVATEGSGLRPSLPRSGACAAVVCGADFDVLLFGGYIEDAGKQREATNEVWVFSTTYSGWRQLPTNPAGVPRARIVSQAVAVSNGVWVIGGWDPSDADILSDIWCLDLETNTWSQVAPAGESLPPISRFQACALGGRIFIHTHRSLENILVLDTLAQPPTLATVPVLPDPQHGAPSSRGLHSLTAIGPKLFLFGGAPQRGPMLADLWVLDTSQEPLQWRALAPEGPAPHARCSHGAAALGSQLVIIGGSYYKEDGSGLQPLDDCWALDAEALHWRQLSIEGDKPSPRNAAVLAAVGDELLYHGGWKPFQETYNDTFILRMQA